MAFGDDDLRAMLSDFGQRVEVLGRPDCEGFLDTRVVNDDGVQRTVLVLRVVAGALGEPARDTLCWINGVGYRLRERVEDAGTIDGAWELWSVGRA